jgi:transposase
MIECYPLYMNTLTLTHPAITRKQLLKQAEEIPGAWVGIRIAALLLMMSGWRSPAISELLGLTRKGVTDWIHKANKEGLKSLVDQPRPGRPARMDAKAAAKLEEALSRSPQEYGLSRSRWDGVVVVEFLQKNLGVALQPRQARNWMHRLGFVIRRPTYRYIQATKQGISEFNRDVKKNSNG